MLEQEITCLFTQRITFARKQGKNNVQQLTNLDLWNQGEPHGLSTIMNYVVLGFGKISAVQSKIFQGKLNEQVKINVNKWWMKHEK